MRSLRHASVVLAAVLIAVAVGVSGCGGPEVPDVVGMRPDDAVRTLQDAGFKLGDVSQVATDGVTLGMVAAQSPAAGEEADEGSAVSLAVSFSDGERTLVPTVTGLSEVTAQNVADTLGLVPVTVEQYSTDVANGIVAAQVPEPEADVAVGATLVIVISKGPAPAKAAVPDVKGKTESAAKSALSAAGFSTETFKVYDSSVAAGAVVAQSPAAGTTVLGGSRVQIIVSMGKGVGAATVPAVTGKTQSAASSAISAVGLKPRVVSQYHATAAKGAVAAQFPSAGASVAAGAEVLIVVSNGPEPVGTVTVPDATGKTAEEASALLSGAGLTVSVEEAASDLDPGMVFYQFPQPNTAVPPSTEVLIVVARAQEP